MIQTGHGDLRQPPVVAFYARGSSDAESCSAQDLGFTRRGRQHRGENWLKSKPRVLTPRLEAEITRAFAPRYSYGFNADACWISADKGASLQKFLSSEKNRSTDEFSN